MWVRRHGAVTPVITAHAAGFAVFPRIIFLYSHCLTGTIQAKTFTTIVGRILCQTHTPFKHGS